MAKKTLTMAFPRGLFKMIKLCMMIESIELFTFMSASVTSIAFQGHSGGVKMKLNVVFLDEIFSNRVQTFLCGCLHNFMAMLITALSTLNVNLRSNN